MAWSKWMKLPSDQMPIVQIFHLCPKINNLQAVSLVQLNLLIRKDFYEILCQNGTNIYQSF